MNIHKQYGAYFVRHPCRDSNPGHFELQSKTHDELPHYPMLEHAFRRMGTIKKKIETNPIAWHKITKQKIIRIINPYLSYNPVPDQSCLL